MTSRTFINPHYAGAPGSPIRELKVFAELPDMISFAGGYPAPELMDAGGLQQIFARMAREDFARACEYGGTEGAFALRAELAKLSNARGMDVGADEVLTLSGSQQGIDLVARTVLEPGDAVLVEAPTYPAAISAFRFAGASVHQLPADDEGMRGDALEQALIRLRPKLLYVVPTFGNPGGRTSSESRRREILRLAARHRCLILEDDPYGELYFHHAPPRSIFSMRHEVDGGQEVAVHLSSLSKTLAPGLRLGWMLGPPEVRRACVLAKQTGDMHASTLTQAAAAAYLAQGLYGEHLPRLRNAYASRAAALASALAQRLGGRVQFQAPAGGMFLWARAPGVDSALWLRSAIAHKVMFVPGVAFFAQDPQHDSLRLSFASQDEGSIARGVSRLEAALHAT